MQPTQPNNSNNKNSNSTHSSDIERIALSTAEIDALVYGYLKSRGYNRALMHLENNQEFSRGQQELTDDQKLTSSALHIMTDRIETMIHSVYGYTHSDNNIEWFDDEYRYLYLWINQCLDCYRIELQSILYPIFIHFIFELLLKSATEIAQNFYYKYNKEHNLMHSQDISQIYQLIQTMDNKQHRIEKFPIYTRYRKHKYQISLSQISHNLLMSWLNSSKFQLLIKTINNHILFKIISYQPTSDKNDTENLIKPPLGINNKKLIEMNKNKISWGISRYIEDRKSVV